MRQHKGDAIMVPYGLAEVRFRSERKYASAVNRKRTSAELAFPSKRMNTVDRRPGSQAPSVDNGDKPLSFQTPKGGTNGAVGDAGPSSNAHLRGSRQAVRLRIPP